MLACARGCREVTTKTNKKNAHDAYRAFRVSRDDDTDDVDDRSRQQSIIRETSDLSPITSRAVRGALVISGPRARALMKWSLRRSYCFGMCPRVADEHSAPPSRTQLQLNGGISLQNDGGANQLGRFMCAMRAFVLSVIISHLSTPRQMCVRVRRVNTCGQRTQTYTQTHACTVNIAIQLMANDMQMGFISI